MRFQVLFDEKPHSVELMFGGERDLKAISHWRSPAVVREEAAVRDAVEFARLAAKRHRYYQHSIPTAATEAEFREIVRENARAEVALLLLVKAVWFKRSPIIGLAQCRRTHCHHIVLEFLAVHPAIAGKLQPRVSGVGTGLIYGLAEVAGQLGVALIWGEATAYSAPFYAHVLDQPDIQDHFFISGAAIERCRQAFREKCFGTLD
jgi:hypothetical protein